MAEDTATAKPVVVVEGRPSVRTRRRRYRSCGPTVGCSEQHQSIAPPADIADKMFDRRELTTIVTTTGPTSGDIQRHPQSAKTDEFGLCKRFCDHR